MLEYSITRNYNDKYDNDQGDRAQAQHTENMYFSIPYFYKGDDGEYDDEEDQKLAELDMYNDASIPDDDNDVIKFRIGDVVCYEDEYYQILRISQKQQANDGEFVINDIFRLKSIDDGNEIDCVYDNDVSLRLIKKNIHPIYTGHQLSIFKQKLMEIFHQQEACMANVGFVDVVKILIENGLSSSEADVLEEDIFREKTFKKQRAAVKIVLDSDRKKFVVHGLGDCNVLSNY